MEKVFNIFRKKVVRYFFTGVFAVLPLVITVAVVAWVAGFVSAFIGPDTMLGGQLSKLGLTVARDSPGVIAYAVGWILVLGVIFLLGVVLELGAKTLLQKTIDAILGRVPLLGNIYTTSKQVVQMLDKKDQDALKGMQAVYCFFGKDHGVGMLALLVSPERFRIDGRDYQIVVIPTAPVPFGGGLFLVPVDQVRHTEMSVDGLMSIYVSMGVTAPDYIACSPESGGAATKPSE